MCTYTRRTAQNHTCTYTSTVSHMWKCTYSHKPFHNAKCTVSHMHMHILSLIMHVCTYSHSTVSHPHMAIGWQDSQDDPRMTRVPSAWSQSHLRHHTCPWAHTYIHFQSHTLIWTHKHTYIHLHTSLFSHTAHTLYVPHTLSHPVTGSVTVHTDRTGTKIVTPLALATHGSLSTWALQAWAPGSSGTATKMGVPIVYSRVGHAHSVTISSLITPICAWLYLFVWFYMCTHEHVLYKHLTCMCVHSVLI